MWMLRNWQVLEGHLPSLAGLLGLYFFLVLGFMLCKHCGCTGAAPLYLCGPEHCSAERELQPRFLAQWEGVTQSEKVKVILCTRERLLVLYASFLKESFDVLSCSCTRCEAQTQNDSSLESNMHTHCNLINLDMGNWHTMFILILFYHGTLHRLGYILYICMYNI